jgi:hypothetical protein
MRRTMDAVASRPDSRKRRGFIGNLRVEGVSEGSRVANSEPSVQSYASTATLYACLRIRLESRRELPSVTEHLGREQVGRGSTGSTTQFSVGPVATCPEMDWLEGSVDA